MMLTQTSEADTAIGVEVTDAPAGLSVIRQAHCAAAIWQRDLAPSLLSWLDALDPARLPLTRLILRPSAVRQALAEACDTAGTPAGAERDRLIDDAAGLATLFADLMRTPYIRLRADVVTTNACRKFHIDAVTARLVCTYRGTGTQYGTSSGGADPARVFTVPTGAPILLRGTLWPDQPRSGLLHRSPPIEGTDETRLLLVLDPVADPAEEPDSEVTRR